MRFVLTRPVDGLKMTLEKHNILRLPFTCKNLPLNKFHWWGNMIIFKLVL